jgi:hypothetical protein
MTTINALIDAYLNDRIELEDYLNLSYALGWENRLALRKLETARFERQRQSAVLMKPCSNPAMKLDGGWDV